MVMLDKNIDQVFDKLTEMADKAEKEGHYIQSAVIGFQLVELYLRLVVNIFAKQNKCSLDILEKLEDKQSFFDLVIFLGLVKPENGISDKLFKFNTKRNMVIHRLFYKIESIETLETILKDFCEEALELMGELHSLIPKK